MRRTPSALTRQAVAAVMLSALAVTAMLAAAGFARAADLTYAPAPTVVYKPAAPVAAICAEPLERVRFFNKDGSPTAPARTNYYYCVTGRMLMPGDVPPPPEYCCRI